jgi:hypothetical protein
MLDFNRLQLAPVRPARDGPAEKKERVCLQCDRMLSSLVP